MDYNTNNVKKDDNKGMSTTSRVEGPAKPSSDGTASPPQSTLTSPSKSGTNDTKLTTSSAIGAIVATREALLVAAATAASASTTNSTRDAKISLADCVKDKKNMITGKNLSNHDDVSSTTTCGAANDDASAESSRTEDTIVVIDDIPIQSITPIVSEEGAATGVETGVETTVVAVDASSVKEDPKEGSVTVAEQQSATNDTNTTTTSTKTTTTTATILKSPSEIQEKSSSASSNNIVVSTQQNDGTTSNTTTTKTATTTTSPTSVKLNSPSTTTPTTVASSTISSKVIKPIVAAATSTTGTAQNAVSTGAIKKQQVASTSKVALLAAAITQSLNCQSTSKGKAQDDQNVGNKQKKTKGDSDAWKDRHLNNLDDSCLRNILEEAYLQRNPADKKNKSEICLQMLNKAESEDEEAYSLRELNSRYRRHNTYSLSTSNNNYHHYHHHSNSFSSSSYSINYHTEQQQQQQHRSQSNYHNNNCPKQGGTLQDLVESINRSDGLLDDYEYSRSSTANSSGGPGNGNSNVGIGSASGGINRNNRRFNNNNSNNNTGTSSSVNKKKNSSVPSRQREGGSVPSNVNVGNNNNYPPNSLNSLLSPKIMLDLQVNSNNNSKSMRKSSSGDAITTNTNNNIAGIDTSNCVDWAGNASNLIESSQDNTNASIRGQSLNTKPMTNRKENRRFTKSLSKDDNDMMVASTSAGARNTQLATVGGSSRNLNKAGIDNMNPTKCKDCVLNRLSMNRSELLDQTEVFQYGRRIPPDGQDVIQELEDLKKPKVFDNHNGDDVVVKKKISPNYFPFNESYNSYQSILANTTNNTENTTTMTTIPMTASSFSSCIDNIGGNPGGNGGGGRSVDGMELAKPNRQGSLGGAIKSKRNDENGNSVNNNMAMASGGSASGQKTK